MPSSNGTGRNEFKWRKKLALKGFKRGKQVYTFCAKMQIPVYAERPLLLGCKAEILFITGHRQRRFQMKSMPLVRLFTRSSLLLAAGSIALLPPTARAEEGRPIQGAFAVTAAVSPNTGSVSFCGGTALALAVEAHGNGYTSLGALSLSLEKTINAPGAMHGCITLTAPNGDTLSAIYDGTEGAPNANGFVFATGTLTFTGGTGRFGGAGGSAAFTAVFRRLPLGTPPFQVAAYYTIHGNLFLPDDGDQ
jgi:hypothetical protein